VCGEIGEAVRKRRYLAHIFSTPCEADAEPAETQVWLAFATKCEYLDAEEAAELTESATRSAAHWSR
jgi:hypothetical protein